MTNQSQPTESLLTFPCMFPIKIMGKSHPEFAATIVEVVREFDGDVEAAKRHLMAKRHEQGGLLGGLNSSDARRALTPRQGAASPAAL